MIRMELSRIVINENSDEQIIVLKELGGERSFPIVIGIFEAAAIDRKIKDAKTSRPMTHDLLESVVRAMGAKLDRIVVTELKESTFYARLHLTQNGKGLEIDSRPSDAIALATYFGAEIWVEEQVLESLGAE